MAHDEFQRVYGTGGALVNAAGVAGGGAMVAEEAVAAADLALLLLRAVLPLLSSTAFSLSTNGLVTCLAHRGLRGGTSAAAELFNATPMESTSSDEAGALNGEGDVDEGVEDDGGTGEEEGFALERGDEAAIVGGSGSNSRRSG